MKVECKNYTKSIGAGVINDILKRFTGDCSVLLIFVNKLAESQSLPELQGRWSNFKLFHLDVEDNARHSEVTLRPFSATKKLTQAMPIVIVVSRAGQIKSSAPEIKSEIMDEDADDQAAAPAAASRGLKSRRRSQNGEGVKDDRVRCIRFPLEQFFFPIIFESNKPTSHSQPLGLIRQQRCRQTLR